MSQIVDIRELNKLIEQKSSFVDVLTNGMDKVIVGQHFGVQQIHNAMRAHQGKCEAGAEPGIAAYCGTW